MLSIHSDNSIHVHLYNYSQTGMTTEVEAKVEKSSIEKKGRKAKKTKSIARTRRDLLLEIQATINTWWVESDVFRADAGEKPP